MRRAGAFGIPKGRQRPFASRKDPTAVTTASIGNRLVSYDHLVGRSTWLKLIGTDGHRLVGRAWDRDRPRVRRKWIAVHAGRVVASATRPRRHRSGPAGMPGRRIRSEAVMAESDVSMRRLRASQAIRALRARYGFDCRRTIPLGFGHIQEAAHVVDSGAIVSFVPPAHSPRKLALIWRLATRSACKRRGRLHEAFVHE